MICNSSTVPSIDAHTTSSDSQKKKTAVVARIDPPLPLSVLGTVDTSQWIPASLYVCTMYICTSMPQQFAADWLATLVAPVYQQGARATSKSKGIYIYIIIIIAIRRKMKKYT